MLVVNVDSVLQNYNERKKNESNNFSLLKIFQTFYLFTMFRFPTPVLLDNPSISRMV